MTTNSKHLLLKQWQTLHNNHENYEQYSLIIKLIAIAITLFSFIFSIATLIALLLLAIVWMQEGIWKTFQSRTANAIIVVENKLAANDVEKDDEFISPVLLYREWQTHRSSTTGLVTEYICNSLKPTVLYPYLPLMLVVLIF